MLTIDIGGTKIAAALVADGPLIGPRRTCATPAADGPDAVLAAAIGLGRDVGSAAAQAGSPGPERVAIASAGVIDPSAGRVLSATDSLPGWAGTDLIGPFVEAFGVPVSVLNDVHAHALGEARFGAGAGYDSVLLIAVGTGIGGGLVLDGQPVLGSRYLAGHVGHLPVAAAVGVPCTCGRIGHLEGLAAGPGIVAQFVERGGRAQRAEQVAVAAEGGDARAAGVISLAGLATGAMIGGLLNVLDPQVVVITGGVSRIGQSWWSALRAGIGDSAMDLVAGTPIVPATAGQGAALLGAAVWAEGVRNT